MVWEIEYTDAFLVWWNELSEAEQNAISISVEVLQRAGPNLTRPHVDTVNGSRHSNMKELRTQHRGKPYRTFFAFDPRRTAVLLIGGDKTGDDRFYGTMIPKADTLYDEYLDEIKKEGLI